VGNTILVQVFTHLPEGAAEASQSAVEFDEDAERRAFRSLATHIERGSQLGFALTLPGLEVDDPHQVMTWNGRTESVQFGVTVPDEAKIGNVIGTVTVSQNSVPIGHVKFKLQITETWSIDSDDVEPVGEDARRYRKAFVSYASPDRSKVLARVQMLQAVGIRYFHDVLDLDPGDRWERELYRHIDESDLFLLFWSAAAKKSEWVMKEVQYALRRKGGDDLAPPEIRPVIIEGPPIVPPPDDLAHLHFNDKAIYFMTEGAI
jgi:hypothetical protein